MSTSLLLEAKNLSKFYLPGFGFTLSQHLRELKKQNRIFVFEGVDFQIKRGECVCLLGGNGTGKSTLLKCLAGVSQFTSGSVKLHGKLATFLTHGYGAYEDLPLRKIILLVQQFFGISYADAVKNVPTIAELAGLEEKLGCSAHQLSEGMRAKVSLFSLYFANFDLLLMDENLNHVDQEYRNRFHEITRQWIAAGKSMVFTTHEKSLVDQFAHRKVQIKERKLVELK